MSWYSVVNRSRGTLLALEVESAESPWKRIKGLLGRRDLEPGRGLWLRPSQGIHTIGMSFAIDALYLDRNNRVVRMYQRLRPGRIAAVSLRARSILELPAGTLSRTQTEVGDVLDFQRIEVNEA